MRNATASGAGGDQVLRCTHPVPCRRCRSALEEWKNRLKDVAVVSKLAVRLYTYVGLGERRTSDAYRLHRQFARHMGHQLLRGALLMQGLQECIGVGDWAAEGAQARSGSFCLPTTPGCRPRPRQAGAGSSASGAWWPLRCC